MRERRKTQKNIIIGGLLAVVLVMTVAYAAFSSQLNITGTSNISSKWDIKITKIEEKNAVGGASHVSKSITGDLTANFSCNLTLPGQSKITYDITVKNEGTLDAVLNNVDINAGTNSAIAFDTSSSSLTKGKTLTAGQSDTITITVIFNDVSEMPESTTSTINVSLVFMQSGTDTSTQSYNYSGIVYRYGTEDLNIGQLIYGYYITNGTEMVNSVGPYEDKSECESVVASNTSVTGYYCELNAISTTEDASSLNKKFYLKHEITNNKITASYVCFVTDAEYCMQGGIEDKDNYTANKAILQKNEAWFKVHDGSCGEHDSYFSCYDGDLSNVSASAYSIGFVNAIDRSSSCSVSDNGSSRCH